MEYLILGLLMLSPMTGYELRQFIRQNLSLICSDSAGSLQTALSKLGREGFVTAEESGGGRRKKTYSITEAGRAAFAGWVAQPMQAERAKNMELSRLFFLGLAGPEERAGAIRGYIRQMERMSVILSAIRERFREAQNGPLPPGRDWEQIFRFQGLTIEYGIAAAEFERGWYTKLLEELEEKP